MWQLTGLCNLNCKHCLRQKYDKPLNELSNELTIQLFKDYIQFHKNHNHPFSMTFSGGNPLIKPCFKELMYISKEAKDDGILNYTNILGNTDTLNDDMLKCFKDCELDSFFVSMDGLKDTHDLQRGVGNFEKNIKWIPELLKNNIEVKIKYTLTKMNMNEIVDVLDLCLKLGCKTFAIGTLILHDDKIKDYINSIDLSAKEHKEVCKKIINYIENLDSKYSFIIQQLFRFNKTSMCQTLEDLNLVEKYQKYLITNHSNFHHHSKSLIPGVIWEDGSIHSRNKSPNDLIGKYPEQTFEEIYESLKHIEIKHKIEFNKEISNKCLKCSLLNLCDHNLKFCCK